MVKGIFTRYRIYLGISLLLVSCSAEPSIEPPSNPQLITHAAGQTAVPENPERIVVLDYGALESAIALGVTPIATTLSGAMNEQPPHLRKHLKNVQVLGLEAQANLETIAMLKPDLIIGCACLNGDVYPQLSQIAPTVFTETAAEDWQENFLFHGKVLGKSQEAREIFAQYQERVQKLGSDPELDAVTISVARIFPERIRLYLKKSFSGQILAQTGLKRPPAQDRLFYKQEISKEKWTALDADILFMITVGNEAQTALDQLKADPLWSHLEVVQQNQVYQVPDYWIGVGFLSAHEVLDDLERYLPPD